MTYLIKERLIKRIIYKDESKVERSQQKTMQHCRARYSNYQNPRRVDTTQEELEVLSKGVQPAHGDLERREQENKYLTVTLLLPSDLWPVSLIS